MEKLSLQNDDLLASWTYSPDAKICAKKKGSNIAFEVEGDRTSISDIALLNMRGWIPSKDVQWDSDLASFYQQFRPVLMGEFTPVLSLVDREISIDKTKTGRMVVFIEKNIPQIRLQVGKMIYPIPVENINREIQYLLKPIEGKITKDDIERITKLAKFTIAKANLNFKSIYFDGFQIIVKLEDKKIPLEVEFSDTQTLIKEKIQEKVQIPPARQRLFSKRKALIGNETLANYNIGIAEYVELLQIPNQETAQPFIYIKFEGKSIPKEVKLTDSIFQLKFKIKLQEGIDVDRQTLIFESQVLNKGSLADYNIFFGANLHLLVRPELKNGLYIKTITGMTFILEATLTDSIDVIKNGIYKKLEIPPVQQRLLCRGRQLEDGRILSDYLIPMGSTLELCLRLRGGGPSPLPFVNLQATNERRMLLDSTGPSWRRVSAGLNLRGICRTSWCDAKGHEVWIEKKFGVFNISKLANECLCPSCNGLLSEVNNCGFYKCIFSVEGASKDSNEINRLRVEAPDNEFLSFTDVITGKSLVNYYYLRITTEQKPDAIEDESTCTIL